MSKGDDPDIERIIGFDGSENKATKSDSEETSNNSDQPNDNNNDSRCFCGKTLDEYSTSDPNWLCHRCWRIQDDSIWFECGDVPECKNEIKDQCYTLCAECAVLKEDFNPNLNENINQIIINKIESALNIIS